MESDRADDAAKERTLRSNAALAAGRGAFLGALVFLLFQLASGDLVLRGLTAWAWMLLPVILYVASELEPRRLGSWVAARSSVLADRLDDKLYWGWLSGRAAGTLIVVGCLLVLVWLFDRFLILYNYVQLAQALILPGVVTWFWADGVQRHPIQVIRLGTLAGAAAGAGWEAVQPFLVAPLIPRELLSFDSESLRSILSSAFQWALYGFAGAVAIERAEGLLVGVRVGAGVMTGALVFEILKWVFGGEWTSWPFVLQELLLAAGWSFGLVRYQPSEVVLNKVRPFSETTAVGPGA